VSIAPGKYVLGPDDGTLSVRTERGGAVAKAGHNLLMRVTSWDGVLEVGDESRVELNVDSSSFKVVEGSGGMQSLDDDDKANIEKTIDDEVLKRRAIGFRSTQVDETDAGLHVAGELTLSGQAHPVTFDLATADGRLKGTAVVKQTDWGMKPYTALFGALKVLDEVKVEIDAALPEGQAG
jgi:polyisoprenoid-binding protein YceI